MVIVAAAVVALAKAEVVVSAAVEVVVAVLCVNTLPTLALKILRFGQTA